MGVKRTGQLSGPRLSACGLSKIPFCGGIQVGKPNFSFQKRQKELARKKKNEEKRQRKLEKNAVKPAEDQGRLVEDRSDTTNSI